MAGLQPRINIENLENATIIKFVDEKILEESQIQALEHSILPVIEQTENPKIVLDFANVQFLSSAVLGLLIRISKKVYQKNGQLRLCSIHPKIFEVFKITRLDKVFEIYQNREEAVK